ncbi:hypothetical protein [Zooshikella sp. RANM57]|uniref:hypothetical protein n=1 Tax=Zooshikella sp. RANM57 TaxID=3425863 RepID=UPI003D6F494C
MNMLTPAEALSVQITEAANCNRLVELSRKLIEAKSGSSPEIPPEKATLFYEAIQERAKELGYW